MQELAYWHGLCCWGIASRVIFAGTVAGRKKWNLVVRVVLFLACTDEPHDVVLARVLLVFNYSVAAQCFHCLPSVDGAALRRNPLPLGHEGG